MTDLSYKNKGFIKSLLIKEPDINLRTIYKLVKSLNTKEISNEHIKQYVTKIRKYDNNKQTFQIVKSFKGGNREIYDRIKNQILTFQGGDDMTIQNKITVFYEKTDAIKPNIWYVSPNERTNYFFYIEVDGDIVACVRINDTNHELDMDFVEEPYKEYYIPLLEKRLEYVMEHKEDMYVLYSEGLEEPRFDRLKELHKEVGMTLNPSTKVQVNGRGPFYWKFEYNRPAKDLIVKFNVPDMKDGVMNYENCSGYMIGKNNYRSLINTAVHCFIPFKNMNNENKNKHEIIKNIKLSTINNQRYNLQNNNIDLSPFDNIKKDKTKYLESLDDSIIINSDLLLDTSNVYILKNPENLLDNTDVSVWGKTIGKWINVKINKTDNTGSTFYDQEKFSSRGINDPSDIFKYMTLLTNRVNLLKGGDSGGPVGIFFGSDKKKKFALIGTYTGGAVINTYQRIKDTDIIKYFVNLASLTDTGTITFQNVKPINANNNAQIIGAVHSNVSSSPTSIIPGPVAPVSSPPVAPVSLPSNFSNVTINKFTKGFENLDKSVQQITQKLANLKQKLINLKIQMAGGAIQKGGANIVKDIPIYENILKIVNNEALLKEFIADTYILLTNLWDPEKNTDLKTYLNNNPTDEIQQYFIKDNDKYYFSDVIFTQIMLGQLNSNTYPNKITQNNLTRYYNKKFKKT